MKNILEEYAKMHDFGPWMTLSFSHTSRNTYRRFALVRTVYSFRSPPY